MIYHVQSRLELFMNRFRTKLRNVVEFDTGTSFAGAYQSLIKSEINLTRKKNLRQGCF